MYRLGIFTGKIYDDKISLHDIFECCVCFTPTEHVSPDSQFVKDLYRRHHIACIGCWQCEESRKNWKEDTNNDAK